MLFYNFVDKRCSTEGVKMFKFHLISFLNNEISKAFKIYIEIYIP